MENNATKPFYNTTIPSDWEITTLGSEIECLEAGVSVNSTDESTNDCDFCILKTSSISEGIFNPNERKKISRKDISRAKLNPKKDSIIISRMNTPDLVGECGYVSETYKNLFLPDRLWQTQFYKKSTVVVKWLNYILNSSDYKLKIKNAATGTSNSMKNISKGSFLSLKIPLPPLPEQRAIAHVLSLMDTVINKNNQLIAQKELRKKWLMQNLLTGKKRLKGFNGDWKEKELGDFINESRIPSINNNVNRRITVKLNLKGIEKRDVRGSEAEDATYYFIRKAGQFIYGKQNLHKGAFGIIPEDLDGYESSQDIPTFDFIGDISPIFFFMFISQENIYKSLERISTGTGSKRIHPESLYKVKCHFPEFQEQSAIARVLQAADKEIQLLKTKTEKLREQKKGMMQLLLTGKKRLNLNLQD